MRNDRQPEPGLDLLLKPKADHGEDSYVGSSRLKGTKAAVPHMPPGASMINTTSI